MARVLQVATTMNQNTVEPPSTSQPGRSFASIPTSTDRVLAFKFKGPITAADFRQAASMLDAAYKKHDKIGLLVRIVGPMTTRLEVFREQFVHVKLEALRHVERYAIVGGPDWLQGAAKMLNPLFRMDVRHFTMDDENDAWEWLGATPQ